MTEKVFASVRSLLAEIVDYAGLFPPSQLPMQAAVENYARYHQSPESWMLARFVVPVQRLTEFTETAQTFRDKSDSVWRLSVLAGEDLDETVGIIDKFNQLSGGKIAADALELKAPDDQAVENACARLPENLKVYFELPLDANLEKTVAALAANKRRAKIRTGGITPEAFPAAEEIVRFIAACLNADVPFKCTAGLHHPVRCIKPLTYEPDAVSSTMHGFLNVFLATALLQQNHDVRAAIEILNAEQSTDFKFSDDGVWLRDVFLTSEQLATARRRIISFGSCSFEEPVADLRTLNLL